MAEVKSGQGFEAGGVVEAVVAIQQMLIWQGFGLFFSVAYCVTVAGNAIVTDVSRKCTWKIKYGQGSRTLLWKLAKIPIRD